MLRAIFDKTSHYKFVRMKKRCFFKYTNHTVHVCQIFYTFMTFLFRLELYKLCSSGAWFDETEILWWLGTRNWGESGAAMPERHSLINQMILLCEPLWISQLFIVELLDSEILCKEGLHDLHLTALLEFILTLCLSPLIPWYGFLVWKFSPSCTGDSACGGFLVFACFFALSTFITSWVVMSL